MRFSISKLLIGIAIFAVALGIGYPTLKFVLYDNVNFTYDRNQTVEYIQSATSGQTQRKLLDAIRQLSVSGDDQIFIAESSLTNDHLHVELISTTFHQPEWLDIELGSGDTISTDSSDIKSTGTYYFFGDIPIDDTIPDDAKVESIHFRHGKSKSNVYTLANTGNGG